MDAKPNPLRSITDPALRFTFIILLVSVCMVAYIYLQPPLNTIIGPYMGKILGLPGDVGTGLFRFATAFVLLGVLPFISAIFFGIKPRDMGLRLDFSFFKSPVFLALLIILPASTIYTSLQGEIKDFYPFSHDLKLLVKSSPIWMLIWGLAYLVLYYFAWEFLFRGLLIGPLQTALGVDSGFRLYLVGFLQILPTTLLHINHPSTETISAVAFGAIAAMFAIKYKSILPSLILHATVGISLDVTIIYFT